MSKDRRMMWSFFRHAVNYYHTINHIRSDLSWVQRRPKNLDYMQSNNYNFVCLHSHLSENEPQLIRFFKKIRIIFMLLSWKSNGISLVRTILQGFNSKLLFQIRQIVILESPNIFRMTIYRHIALPCTLALTATISSEVLAIFCRWGDFGFYNSYELEPVVLGACILPYRIIRLTTKR